MIFTPHKASQFSESNFLIVEKTWRIMKLNLYQRITMTYIDQIHIVFAALFGLAAVGNIAAVGWWLETLADKTN